MKKKDKKLADFLEKNEGYLLSLPALAEGWDGPEEDKTWASLNTKEDAGK